MPESFRSIIPLWGSLCFLQDTKSLVLLAKNPVESFQRYSNTNSNTSISIRMFQPSEDKTGPSLTTFSVTKKKSLKRYHSCGKKIKNTVIWDLTSHFPSMCSKAFCKRKEKKKKRLYLISKSPIPLLLIPWEHASPEGEAVLTRIPQGLFTSSLSSSSSSPCLALILRLEIVSRFFLIPHKPKWTLTQQRNCFLLQAVHF